MIRTLRRALVLVLVAAWYAHLAQAQVLGAQAQARQREAPGTQVQDSSLGGQLFYQLLLGEFKALDGDAGAAYSLILDAARQTGDSRLYKRAVEIALRSRSGESALQAARAWRTALPQSRDANRYLFQILVGLNRIADALEPLKRELTLAGEHERAAAIKSIPAAFAGAADKKLCASVVEQALADYLNDPALGPAAWTSVGRMRLAATDLAGALQAAQRGQAMDATADGPAILALGLMQAKVSEAEPLVLKYLDGKPRHEVRMDYARVLIDQMRYTESALQLAAVTRDKPDYAQAWLVKGTLELQNRQAQDAEKSLLRYVELASVDDSGATRAETSRGLTQAYLHLAELAERRHDYDAAQSWLDKIDDADNMISVQIRRAGIVARQGHLDQARAMIQALPARNAADTRMKIGAEVQLLRDSKQYQLAFDLIKNALLTNPNDVDFLYDQSMLAEKLGDMKEMERLLRRVIAEKPEYQHAYNALGYSLADRNVRLPEARALILKALEYAPGDPFISDSLAWVEFRSGNFPQALSILQQAFKDQPDAEIAAHLGEVLWAMGDHAQAIAVWKQGIALNAESETLQETLKRLRVKL